MDNPEGVSGTKSPRSWRVWGGGVPSPLESLEVVWEGAVPPSQIFFKNFYLKMVSFGAFWVALCVTYLLIYWILKETVVTFRLMRERTRGCVCPSYPNNSSAAHSNSSSRTQKMGFIRPWLCQTFFFHNWKEWVMHQTKYCTNVIIASVSGRKDKLTNKHSWNRCRLSWSVLFSPIWM